MAKENTGQRFFNLRGSTERRREAPALSIAIDLVVSRPLCATRAFGARPQPVHKNEPQPTPGLLRISCYLAFALAAAAVVADGSAKAITASPSTKLVPGF